MILLGSSMVGKTSIFKVLTTGIYDYNVQQTLGVDYENVIYNKVNFGLRASCGGLLYINIGKPFYNFCSWFVFIFDITNEKSFIEVKQYYNYICKYKTGDYNILLIGNKSDLSYKRTVSKISALKLADEINAIKYIEISAKENLNVFDIFKQIIEYENKPIAEKHLHNKKSELAEYLSSFCSYL